MNSYTVYFDESRLNPDYNGLFEAVIRDAESIEIAKEKARDHAKKRGLNFEECSYMYELRENDENYPEEAGEIIYWEDLE